MIRLSFGKILSSLVVAAALAGLGPSCNGGVGGTDSNTHWLDQCQTDADCPGLSCICGLCTARCTNADSCDGLQDAACAPPVDCTSSTEPACVATCSTDAECTVIHAGLSCESGQCGYSSGGSGGTDAGAPVDGAAPDGSSSSGGSGGGGSGGTGAGGSGDTSALCAPLDARSDGTLCPAILGYAFSGADCEPVVCGCAGTECDQIAPTFGECRRAHASCITDLCAPMDAANSSLPLPCIAPPGWSWDGERCIQIGCGCSGTDCDTLYKSVGDCTETHAECAGGVFDACVSPSDCTLTSAGCCSPCVVVALTDYVALTDERVASYREEVCSEPQNSCLLPCIPEPTPSTFYATCEVGRCAPIDIAEWAQCTGDLDCQVRSRDCCETCTAPTDLSDLVAVSDPFSYGSLVCGLDPECDPCSPNYGRARAQCIEGHCALLWVDTR